MNVVSIRKPDPQGLGKRIEANQKAIDSLALNSGTWRIEGVPGLYLRCRAKTKSFLIQRRVGGRLLKETLGELSMKQAKEAAMRTWSQMRPKPRQHELVTLEMAIEQYLQDKPLAEKTKIGYRYNTERYLKDWKKRSLLEIGIDRAGVRQLQRHITQNHGPATSNQVVHLISAVYRWHRKIDTTLPEPPTTAVAVHNIPARDWAFTQDELRNWWSSVEPIEGKPVERGVKTLGPIKRMWWLTTLFTGARKGSVEALKWADIDFERKVIHFRVTKGDRPYVVPMAEKLATLFQEYQTDESIPPSDWVFPSSVINGNHIVDVKNDKDGVAPAHRLRHTFRTTLAEIGATPDQARMLMGHSMGGDVSRGYITAPLLIESLRPVTNAVAERYLKIVNPA